MENLTVEQITLVVVGILLGISLVTAIISLILETDRSRQWYGDWFQGVSTEMIGAAVTTIFFTFIVGSVQTQQAQVELRAELIKQLGSSVNSEAVRAAEELNSQGWLRDGSVQGVDLGFADLAGARMFFADLRQATLFSANLQHTDLNEANLAEAILQAADLQRATLQRVNLQQANLEAANLQGVDLTGANLTGAYLENANLEAALLTDARFGADTTLPDGSQWTTDTDMARFTDAEHPDFWRPQADENGVLPWWIDTEAE